MKVLRSVERYSDGTQRVKEVVEDDENGRSEKVYRLDSNNNPLQLSDSSDKRE